MPTPFFTNINVARSLDEPIYQNLFEVTFTLPKILQTKFPNATSILLENCLTAPLPSYPALGVADQRFKYSTRLFLKTPDTTSIDSLEFDFELNQDINYHINVWNVLRAWYDLGWNQSDGSLHYKRNMVGDIVVNQHDREGHIIRRVVYFNTQMLQPTGWEALDWGQSGIIKGKAKFCCDYWDDFIYTNAGTV